MICFYRFLCDGIILALLVFQNWHCAAAKNKCAKMCGGIFSMAYNNPLCDVLTTSCAYIYSGFYPGYLLHYQHLQLDW